MDQPETIETAAADLESAARAWEQRGDARPLQRWLTREAGGDSLPPRRPVAAWRPSLERIEAARQHRPDGWPDALDARLESLVRGALRFARPDGSAVFGPVGTPPGWGATLQGLTTRLSDPGLQTVADWWFPSPHRAKSRRARPAAPPPLPAVAAPPRPIALLRADWKPQGDLLAIDQRGESALIELMGAGHRWLGPRWTTPPEAAPARLVHWTTGPLADVAEWSYRDGAARVTRTAVLLRGRQMALIAEERASRTSVGSCAIEIERSPGVRLEAASEPGRAGRLIGPRRAAAEILAPVAAALRDGPSSIQLRLTTEARRAWLPWVVSWEPGRTRRGAYWKPLTVTQRTRRCGPEVAIAARVAWSRGRDSLLIYRSLARPALRCFLGHWTTARFLVAVFTPEGEVKPLVSLED